jgi:integrative and conjugative element protein (TIGR02256 family)
VKVSIARDALVTILVEAQASADGKETGGILAGFELDGELVITVAGGPGADATRRPDLFVRDLADADQLLERVFDESGAVWIGDWHTHTIVSGHPSATDLVSYRRLLEDSELGFSVFLALIVTSANETFADAELTAWVASDRGVVQGQISLP